MHNDKKLLFIMRHAKSDKSVIDMIDFDRPLNERGEGEPKVIAKVLNKLGVKIEKALVSSARRTVETWNLLEKKLDDPPEVVFDKRIYNATCEDAIDALIDEADGCASLMVIGHNPSLSEMTEYLTGEYHELATAACAVLSAREKSLSASLKKPGRFKLEQLILAQS
jgi:phosphohistidine phosphatase